jgi:acyl-CoA synthetase (AMP-forming)/AMP-acid ligase II
VYSPEVERVVQEHPAVAEVAVIGIPDETWGESIVAIVAPKPGATVDPEDLIAYCRDHLAAYKCPRRVEVRDVLPRNASGKLLKPQLRRPYWQDQERRI